MRQLQRHLAVIFVVLTSTFQPCAAADDLTGSPSPALRWQDLAPIPNPVGLGGPLVGTHGGALVVAGGANFPAAPPWEVDGMPAGKKAWHTTIYLLSKPNGQWKSAGELPYPLAYAPVISTNEGIYLLGGETFGTVAGADEATNHATAEVLRLEVKLDDGSVAVVRNALPPLPKPCRYHATAIADGVIYVAAGQPSADGRQLYGKAFWQLDLNAAPERRQWKRLLPWPGLAREKMSLVAQAGADGKLGIYLLGGSRWANDAAGKPDFANFRYFDDLYRFDVDTGKWDTKRLAKIPASPLGKPPADGYTFDTIRQRWLPESDKAPRIDDRPTRTPRRRATGTLAAAPAIGLGDRYILLFSGDTGRHIMLPNQDRGLFPWAIVRYDTHTDRWTRLADMPLGVVTTSANWWNERIVIVSGEIRPGVRTDRVQSAVVGE